MNKIRLSLKVVDRLRIQPDGQCRPQSHGASMANNNYYDVTNPNSNSEQVERQHSALH